jgi:DNA-binding SARP family transcriptional activator
MTAAVLSLFLLWLLFLLLVPKREWDTIRERLRQTKLGDRAYLFGTPALFGPGRLAAALGEALRFVETGIPLYLLARWAEANGRHRRALAAMASPPEAPPAPKAQAVSVRQYAMPPMAWRREWEAELLRNESESSIAESESAVVAVHSRSSCSLRIRTLGVFQLASDGEDLTAQLLHHPVLCFIWLYVLTHQVVRPAVSLHRQLLAEEAFPGVEKEVQRNRLRGRLLEIRRLLPVAIGERLRVGTEFVEFQLDATEFDVHIIRQTADEWAGRAGLLPRQGVAEVEAAMALYTGEYLPIWDELDQRLTGGRGAAGELVRSVRLLMEDAYIRLLIGLGHHYGARRDPRRGIPLLEEVLRRQPDREDVANLLAAAYRDTGQPSRARQLETTYRTDVTQPRPKFDTEKR